MLTKQQGKILDIIINYIEEEGFSPTVREIGELANLSSSSTVHGYLVRLEKHGYIERKLDCPRAIKVIKAPSKEIDFGERVKILRENAKTTKDEVNLPKGYELVTHKVASEALKALAEFFKEEGVSQKEKEAVLGCVACFFLETSKEEVERARQRLNELMLSL